MRRARETVRGIIMTSLYGIAVVRGVFVDAQFRCGLGDFLRVAGGSGFRGAIRHGQADAAQVSSMSRFLIHLFAFGFYTFALLLLTGRTFDWEETRKTFYLGGMRYGALMSLATFFATWMSAASLVGFTVWIMQDGYVAFAGSVHGWLFGLLPMPILVHRLRKRHVISVPEWLLAEYGDRRLRWLGALAMLFAYMLYLVIQFRAFGEIASHMLKIPVGFSAMALVYLFVLYTTFGGYPSVVRSDALSSVLILGGVSVAFLAAVFIYGSPASAHTIIARTEPRMLDSWRSWHDGLVTLSLALSWGFGVASNPQYSVRLMAARRTKDALIVVVAASFLVGWIYFSLTNLGIICRAFAPELMPVPFETGQFAAYFDAALPLWASLPLLIGVLAAAVSTANSELLLATCALCYDLAPTWAQPNESKKSKKTENPLSESRFLFVNRLVIVIIATGSLFLSQLSLPGILAIGRISWTLLAVCFFFPLYFPLGRERVRRRIFAVTASSLLLHALLILLTPLSAEVSMLVQLLLQGVVYAYLSLSGRGAKRMASSP